MSKNLTIKWFDTIDSTNLQALREMENASEGCVWIADFQTAGRGQRGNTWVSAKGENLTFTTLFRPEFLYVAKQSAISHVVSLGVCNYLINKGLDAKIKWPNDIYVADKKICGMLIEHTLCGDKLSASIAGIGVNLNQKEFDPKALNPTSIVLATGVSSLYDRKEELTLLLSEIYTLYEDLQNGYGDEIKQDYMSHLYRLNEYHLFKEIDSNAKADIPAEQMPCGEAFEARIIGIDNHFCLILEHKSGEIKHYAFKEIKYVV